jgi:hypothetical protein
MVFAGESRAVVRLWRSGGQGAGAASTLVDPDLNGPIASPAS